MPKLGTRSRLPPGSRRTGDGVGPFATAFSRQIFSREQGGACAICRRRPARRLCIDHCHATRKVRGLLCDNCNIALGLLDDDPDRLRAALAYVLRARGVVEARGGCRADIFVVTAGAAFEGRFAAAGHALRLQAEVGRFGLGWSPSPHPSQPKSDLSDFGQSLSDRARVNPSSAAKSGEREQSESVALLRMSLGAH